MGRSSLEEVYAGHGDWCRDSPVRWAIYDNFNLLVGITILITSGPYLLLQMAAVTIWDILDRSTFNFVGFSKAISSKLSPFFSRFTRHPADGFMVVLMIWLGVALPSYFFVEMMNVRENGFSFPRVVLYNIIRIGPIYVNFMNIYVMCHKEAHLTPGGIFKPNSWLDFLLNRVFNHWAGLFQGLVPGGFTYSHLLNHHKYDNDYRDIVTTAYRPRDSFVSFVKYLPDWFYYSCNLTTLLSFIREKRWILVFKTVAASIYHLLFLTLCYYGSGQSSLFLAFYCIYPYFEANILLGIVNFVWHAFIDPREPFNDYINSTTIVNGLNFTLQEEYHVVHHQYPGLHWTRHSEMFEKHKHEYYRSDIPGSIFQNENVFVLFIYMITKSYDKIADLFYDPEGKVKMDKQQLAQLFKIRLQCHGHDVAVTAGKTHRYDKNTSPVYEVLKAE